MAKKATMPKELFVYRESDGEVEWFEARETVNGCATMDQSRIVGHYRLDELFRVEVETIHFPIKK